MYKSKTENIEVYFICYKKEMNLVESYYDEILDIHYWYFNAYLSYKYWKQSFKNYDLGEITKQLLTVGASRYILYQLENGEYKNKREYNKLTKDLALIEKELEKIITEEELINNLKWYKHTI